MEKSFTLIEHYPDRWRELRELQAICDTDIVGDDVHTLQHLYECMEQELNNSFFELDEYACSRWEKMLGIIPSNEATVDDRRFAICTRLFLLSPYTIEGVEDALASILGERKTRIKADVSTKEVKVIMHLDSRFKIDTITELMDAIIPANMKLTMSVDYTTFQDLENETHTQLEEYKHEDIPVTDELQE